MIKSNSFTIIDLGSSKIRFSVFDKNLKLLFKNSSIIKYKDNFLDYFSNLQNTIKIAEKKISSHIKDANVILDSREMFIIDISLNKNFDKKSKIKTAYNSTLLELKHLINNNYLNYEIIHIIICECNVDGKTYNQLPKEDKELNNLKIDFKLICYSKLLLNTLRQEFNLININIKNFFCTSYVKTLTYVKELNLNKISFLEIGLERTSFIFFEKKNLKYIQSVPIGSNHITKDISKILKISLNEAEKIKKLLSKSETEFSFENNLENQTIINQILNKKISIDLLKKVVLYRIQEILDLSFKKSETSSFDFKNSDFFLIGDGSILLNNNSFYLNDKFKFNSINFFGETDESICYAGLTHLFDKNELAETINKKQGLFEKFFNLFDK